MWGAVWPLPQVVGIRVASAFKCPLASPVQHLGAVGACSFLQDTGQAAAPCPTCLGLRRSILYSRSMWFCGGSPTQALGMGRVSAGPDPEPAPLQPASPRTRAQSSEWAKDQGWGSPSGAHLKMFSIQLRWRKSGLTTGLPGGTSGALKRKPSSDSTGWKPCGSGSTSVQKLTRWHSSVSMARSSMMGAARSESCGVDRLGGGWGR